MSPLYEDIKRLVTRVPRGTGGGAIQLAADENGPLAQERFENQCPIQLSVVSRVANLASLVQIETPISRMRRPERLTVLPTWIRKLVYHLMVHNTIGVIMIRDRVTNRISEIYVTNDYVKPTAMQSNGSYTYSYTEGEKTYDNVPEEDILEFSWTVTYAQNTKPVTDALIKAENEFWVQFWNASKLRGLVGYDDEETLLGKLSGDQTDKALKALGEDMAQRNIALLPTRMKYFPASTQEKLLDMQEAVLRSWCHYYGVPTSIFGVDLPTHSTTTLTATYGALVRQVIMPMLEPVWTGISDYFSQMDNKVMPIVADYSRIEKAGMGEIGDVLMKLAQTDAFTRNDLRKMAGQDELPGDEGNKIAQGAGKTDTQGDSNDEGTGGNSGRNGS